MHLTLKIVKTVINKSRLIFRLTIDRDAIWIDRDAANIYRNAL